MHQHDAGIWRLDLLRDFEESWYQEGACTTKHNLPAHTCFPVLQLDHTCLEWELGIIIVESLQHPKGFFADGLRQLLRGRDADQRETCDDDGKE